MSSNVIKTKLPEDLHEVRDWHHVEKLKHESSKPKCDFVLYNKMLMINSKVLKRIQLLA